MKINEFNQPKKIDESLAGAMFGDVPMAALKGLFSGKGGKHQLAQDIFLRDFYQDAITSLDNGVKSGYVNPKQTSPGPSQTTQFGNATPSGAGPVTGAPGSTITTPNNPNTLNAPTLPQSGTTVNTRVGTPGSPGSIATGGPGAPAPRTGTTATTPPAAPAAAPAPKPTNIRGSFTQQGAAPSAAAPLKPTSTNVRFNTPNTQQNPNDQQYKWAPKGMKITPNTKLSSLGATGNLAESTYHNLNRVFESVVSEMNGEEAETVSIADHMLEWFGRYMDGANWESKKAAVIPMIKKIQDTYGSDKGKAAIKNLAKFAYSITGQGGGFPAGAKNAVQNTTGITGTQSSGKLTPEQLAAELAALKPQDREKVIQTVQKATR